MRSLAGKSLAAVMYPFGGTEPGAALGKGEAAYVMVDVSLPRGAKLPRRLEHRLSIALQPASAVVANRFAAAPTARRQRAARSSWRRRCAATAGRRQRLLRRADLAPGGPAAGRRRPLRGRALRDRLHPDHAAGPAHDRPTRPARQLPLLRRPSLLGGAGRVVARRRRPAPRRRPARLPPATRGRRAGGNHVVVDLGRGRYALYAHLQPGSIARPHRPAGASRPASSAGSAAAATPTPPTSTSS